MFYHVSLGFYIFLEVGVYCLIFMFLLNHVHFIVIRKPRNSGEKPLFPDSYEHLRLLTF